MRITRSIKFFFQRLTRGWDESDVWNLDITTAEFLVPRLKLLKKITISVPHSILVECNDDMDEASKLWHEVLDKMIKTFEDISNDDFLPLVRNHESINEGLDLFRKYYFDLWD